MSPEDKKALGWGLGILGALFLLSRSSAAAATAGGTGQSWLASLFGAGKTTTTPVRQATGTQVTSATDTPMATIALPGGSKINIPSLSSLLSIFGSSSGAGSSTPTQSSVTPSPVAVSPVPASLQGTDADPSMPSRAPDIPVAPQTPPVGETIQPDGTVDNPPDAGAAAASVYQDTSYQPVDTLPADLASYM